MSTPNTAPACIHRPPCPSATDPSPLAAAIVSDPQTDYCQGWDRLCNGIVVFNDGGALLPDGQVLREANRTPLVDKAAR